MKKIIFQVMLSLDGYFEGPNGELDWHNVDEEFNDYAICLLHKVDTLLFGRKTYEMMANYWPSPHAVEDDPVVADYMNSKDKIVCSRTLTKADWTNSRVLNENVVDSIKALKQQKGKDIAVFGSCDLAKTLMHENLIDEYRIITAPVMLGKGRSFMQGLEDVRSLKLNKTWIFNSGNVLNYYKMQ
jgi:dihydrofolate reductase